jgi:hypothetical protein
MVSLQKNRGAGQRHCSMVAYPQTPGTVIPPRDDGSAARTGSSGLERGEGQYCGGSAEML